MHKPFVATQQSITAKRTKTKQLPSRSFLCWIRGTINKKSNAFFPVRIRGRRTRQWPSQGHLEDREPLPSARPPDQASGADQRWRYPPGARARNAADNCKLYIVVRAVSFFTLYLERLAAQTFGTANAICHLKCYAGRLLLFLRVRPWLIC